MSGIAAIASWGSPAVEPHPLGEMLGAMAHRGAVPTTRTFGKATIGAVLRHVTPEDAFDVQPWADGEATLVMDGRLDNRGEVAQKLGLPRPDASLPDSHLVLAAYLRWHEDAPRHLVGDFACAVWDERREALLAWRDHVGTRPLYWTGGPGWLAVASEVHALLCIPGVPQELDPEFLVPWRLGHWQPRHCTAIRGIERVPPGTVLTATADGTRWQPYWRAADVPVQEDMTMQEASDEARRLFRQAVQRRMRTAQPLACLLSGGVDSSSVAVVAQDIVGKGPLDAFSMVFPGFPEVDETPYMRDVVFRAGLEWHPIDVRRDGPWEGLGSRTVFEGGPPLTPHASFLLALYRKAGDAGFKVVLDGSEGDQVIGYGNLYHQTLLRRGRILAAWSWWKRTYPARSESKWPFIAAGLAMIPGARAAYHFLRPSLRPRSFAEETRFGGPVSKPLRRRYERWLRRSPLNKTWVGDEEWQRIVLDHGPIPQLLEMLDLNLARFGMEHRSPMFDRDFMEHCLRVPSRHRTRGQAIGRLFFREAMRDLLPESVANRTSKVAFDRPFEAATARGVPTKRPRSEEAEVPSGLFPEWRPDEPAHLALQRQAVTEAVKWLRNQHTIVK